MDLQALATTEESIPDIISITEMTPEEARSSLSARPHHNNGPIQTLRAKHHKLAKLIAMDFKDQDIARKVGYAINTVRTLKSNPAIKELIEHYRGEFDESVSEIHERMESVILDLLYEIEDRLEDDGKREQISFSELKELTKDFLDRTGRGPIKRIEQRTVSENRHAGIIKHVREVAAQKRFDAGRGRLVGEGSTVGRALPEGERAGVGGVQERQSVVEGAEADWSDSAGTGV